MSAALTVQCEVHFRRGERGVKRLESGPEPVPPKVAGRVPRVARLLALAHRFEGLIRAGAVADYAEIAHLGHVSRARVTQIMDLLLLAPDIQDAILFLPPTENGH